MFLEGVLLYLMTFSQNLHQEKSACFSASTNPNFDTSKRKLPDNIVHYWPKK